MCPKVSEKPKRARKGVTLSIKLDVIRRFDRGERNRDIVRALNLPASTIRCIYTQRDRILKAAEVTMGSACSKVVSYSRHPVMDKMESLLIEWIGGFAKRGVPLSYPILKEKSVSFFNKLKQKALDDGDESVTNVEFKGSHGWFERFLRRGQLHYLKVASENASADTEAAEKFQEELRKTITEGGYSYKQVFNCDETAIYWKKLPSKTFISIEEKQAKGHRPSKDKFTLMPVINATGDAVLKPLLVYHSENPRALKGINKNTLPVVFRSHPSGLNTQLIFSEYMSGYVSPFVEKYCRENNLDNRCLVIVDNCSAHPPGITEYGGNIHVVFLPPNTSSLLQPCEQGLIATIKALYTLSVMSFIASAIDREGNSEASLRGIWKDFNIKLAIVNLGDALDRLTVSMRNGVWRKLCPEALKDFKSFELKTVNTAIVTLAKEVGFTEVDEDDIEELLESHDQELTDEELMWLQEERVQIETECSCKQPESVVVQELDLKRLREIFTKIDSAAGIAEKYDSNFERARKFRAGLQDVLSAYKELYDRKMHDAKQSDILSYFKTPTSATEDGEPRPSTSRQADIGKSADVSGVPAQMDSGDDKMSIVDPLPVSPIPPTKPNLRRINCTHHLHYHLPSAFQSARCLPNTAYARKKNSNSCLTSGIGCHAESFISCTSVKREIEEMENGNCSKTVASERASSDQKYGCFDEIYVEDIKPDIKEEPLDESVIQEETDLVLRKWCSNSSEPCSNTRTPFEDCEETIPESDLVLPSEKRGVFVASGMLDGEMKTVTRAVSDDNLSESNISSEVEYYDEDDEDYDPKKKVKKLTKKNIALQEEKEAAIAKRKAEIAEKKAAIKKAILEKKIARAKRRAENAKRKAAARKALLAERRAAKAKLKAALAERKAVKNETDDQQEEAVEFVDLKETSDEDEEDTKREVANKLHASDSECEADFHGNVNTAETSEDDEHEMKVDDPDPSCFWELISDVTAEKPRKLSFIPEFKGTHSVVGFANLSPAKCFEKFFPKTIFEHVAKETNRYARHILGKLGEISPKSMYSRWKEVCSKDIEVFVALEIAMGLLLKPTPESYFSDCHWLLRTPGFGIVFSRTQYQLIQTFLHFANNEDKSSSDDRLYKIRPVLDAVNDKYSQMYNSNRDLSVDECMVKFRGKLFFQEYRACKPSSDLELKVWSLCDSHTGYILKVHVSVGKDAENVKEEETGCRIVESLLSSFENKGHVVYIDKLYSGVTLFDSLRFKQIGACGMVDPSRKGLPAEMKRPKQTREDFPVIWENKEKHMLASTWQETFQVHILSSVGDAGLMVVDVNSRMGKQFVYKPNMYLLYSKYMGGVQKFDQLCSVYPFNRKSKKWYQSIWYFLIEVALVNAHICYNIQNPGKQLTGKKFRELVTDELLEGYDRNSRIKQENSCPADFEKRPRGHYPSRQCKTKSKLYCRVCSIPPSECINKGNGLCSKKSTLYFCEECNDKPPLCIMPCFQIYHTESNYKKYCKCKVIE